MSLTLSEFVGGLNHLIKMRPELANATAVYSTDDEGNRFHECICNGTVGFFDENLNEFTEEDPSNGIQPNAVCVN